MNDKPSKYQMENSIELLNSVKRVNTPEGLFSRIEKRIENVKDNVVPLTWVKLAAAVFVCVFSVEIFLLSNQSELSNLTELILTADNTLYDE